MRGSVFDAHRQTGVFKCNSDCGIGNVGFAIAIWEQITFVFVVLPEFSEGLQCCRRNWYQALTVTFADDGQVPGWFVNVANLHFDRFAESGPAGIHHVQTTAIYRILDSIDNFYAIAVTQHVGQTHLTEGLHFFLNRCQSQSRVSWKKNRNAKRSTLKVPLAGFWR